MNDDLLLMDTRCWLWAQLRLVDQLSRRALSAIRLGRIRRPVARFGCLELGTWNAPHSVAISRASYMAIPRTVSWRRRHGFRGLPYSPKTSG